MATYILCIEHPRPMHLSRESNPGPLALQANTLCNEPFERLINSYSEPWLVLLQHHTCPLAAVIIFHHQLCHFTTTLIRFTKSSRPGSLAPSFFYAFFSSNLNSFYGPTTKEGRQSGSTELAQQFVNSRCTVHYSVHFGYVNGDLVTCRSCPFSVRMLYLPPCPPVKGRVRPTPSFFNSCFLFCIACHPVSIPCIGQASILLYSFMHSRAFHQFFISYFVSTLLSRLRSFHPPQSQSS